MKQESKYENSRIKRLPMDAGESIEEMVRRCLATNEPITDTAPIIYTDSKDGVLPQYDPRTDRQEIALDAIDKYNASETAKSDNKVEENPVTSTEEKNE